MHSTAKMTNVIRLAIGWIVALQYAAITASAFAATSGPTFATTKPIFAIRRSGHHDGHSKKSALFARGGGEEEEDNADLRTVLVTGGTGYIGSHTCLELLSTGRYKVVVIDNLENSSEESLNRVKQLLLDNPEAADAAKDDRLVFRNCDIRDADKLRDVLTEFPSISSCVHFAGLKAVGESVSKPLEYYNVNVGGTTTLLQQLQENEVKHFVFSSSATVYGEPEMLPLKENARLTATNPYGRTKLFIEEILRDLYASKPDMWNI